MIHASISSEHSSAHGCAGGENGYAVSGVGEKEAKGCVDANTRRNAGRVVRRLALARAHAFAAVFARGFVLAEPQIVRFPVFAAEVV